MEARGKENIARNLLAKGSTIEFVHDVTGLDMETIKGLADNTPRPRRNYRLAWGKRPGNKSAPVGLHW